MGEILVFWIENKLGLDLPFFQDPKKFRKAISNGYLIGEILRKFNIISDDQCVSLKKSLTNKSCIKNMQRLHTWLRDSGLDTDFQDLLAIVEEEPGAAMRFIYRIYLWLESPKSYTIAGFSQLSTLKRQLWEEQDENQPGCPLQISSDVTTMEFKPWESLAERNRQYSTENGEIKIASDSREKLFYDIPLLPPILLNVRPPGGMIQEELEDLYYDFRPARNPNDEPGPEKPYKVWQREDNSLLCSFRFKPHSMKDVRQSTLSRARRREILESMEEMKKLNEVVRSNLENTNNVGGKIYEDGRGDYEEYKKNLKSMKRKLQQEQQLNIERGNYRKSLTCKMQTSIPCELHSQMEQEILNRVSALPSREKGLAEFVTLTHSQKQSFLDHMVFEQGQLAQHKFEDMQKQLAINQQQTALRQSLETQSDKLNQIIEYKTLETQQESVLVKHKKVIEGMISNLLDLVMKVATFREAVGYNPPEPLMDEWRAVFNLMDNLMEQDENQAEQVEFLDDMYVSEYIFRNGSWNLGAPPPGDQALVQENHILKKMVSYVLENIYPPPEPEPTLPCPEFKGAVVLAGVHFTWKPAVVRNILLEATISYGKLQVLDSTSIVQEAIKAFANSMVTSFENSESGSVSANRFAYPNEVDGEVQTLWKQTSRAPYLAGEENEEGEGAPGGVTPIVKFNNTDQNSLASKKQFMKKNSGRKIRMELGDTTKKRNSIDSKSRVKSTIHSRRSRPDKPKKITGIKGETEGERDMTADPELSADGGTSTGGFDDDDETVNGVTGKAVEAAFRKQKDKMRRKSSETPRNGHKSANMSNTLDIVRSTLKESMKVHAGTDDDVQVLFSPEDQPETWPEFIKLGKIALDQLLGGSPINEDTTSKIIVERMRHYPSDSFVVILNYPHALCQAISLEKAVRDNNLKAPPCYHHADMLIQQYKELRTAEAGQLISLALGTPLSKLNHRSMLFKYTNEEEQSGTQEPFKSFLDGFIIADLSLERNVGSPPMLTNFGEARSKIIETPGKSVQERISILLHISFLHLKAFYDEHGIGFCIEMGMEEELYYPAMKERVQTIIQRKVKNVTETNTPSQLFKKGTESESFKNSHKPSELNMNPQISSTIPEAVLVLGDEEIGEESVDKPSSATNPNEESTVGSEYTQNKKLSKQKGKPKTKSRGKKRDSEARSEPTSENPDGTTSEDKPVNNEELNVPVSEITSQGTDTAEEPLQSKSKEPLLDVTPTSTVPLSQNIIYNIDPESIKVLGDFWMKMESSYISGLRNSLKAIRAHHDRITKYGIDFRTELNKILARPDKKQDLLLQFQENFNQVSNYVRGDFEVKAELHNRVRELRNRLSAICDERHNESAMEMYSILSEGYIEGESEILANLFITLIQLEADHFCDVVQFINDFYSMTGLAKPEPIPWCETLRIDLISRAQFNSSKNSGYPSEELNGEAQSRQNVPVFSTKPSELIPFQKKNTKSANPSMEVQRSHMTHNYSAEDTNSVTGDAQDKSSTGRKKSNIKEPLPTSVNSNNNLISPEGKSQEGNVADENEPKEDAAELGHTESSRSDTTRSKSHKGKKSPKSRSSKRKGKDYFGEDEGEEEIQRKKSYHEQILKNYDLSVQFLDSIMSRVYSNLEKIQNHTLKVIRSNVGGGQSGTQLPDEESPVKLREVPSSVPSKKASSKEISKKGARLSEDKKSFEKITEKTRSGSDSLNSDTKKSKKRAQKDSLKSKKQKMDKNKSFSEGDLIQKSDELKSGKVSLTDPALAIRSRESIGGLTKFSTLPNPSGISDTLGIGSISRNKVKGVKRTAEWRLAIELEGKRAGEQLRAIHENAKREMLQLKESLVQVIMFGEQDSALHYKSEIENVATVCDVFRFATENGLPVEVDLTLESEGLLLGCSKGGHSASLSDSSSCSRELKSRSPTGSTTGVPEKEDFASTVEN